MVLATINISITIIAYKKNLIGDYIYFFIFVSSFVEDGVNWGVIQILNNKLMMICI